MKKLLALMMVLAMASVAFAQVDDAIDGLGVYFDTEGMLFCNNPGPGVADIYLLLTNPSQPQVSAWEVELGASAVWGFGGWDLYGGTDVGSDGAWPAHPYSHYFAVGNGGAPLVPTGNVIILAHWQGYYQGMDVSFFLRGHPGSQSFPNGGFGYAPIAGVLVECVHPTGGDPETPVAMLGSTCEVIGTDNTSWSNVKELYR